jgi:hypothetical protein
VDSVLTVAAVDFGTHAPGEFQDQTAVAYNFGFGPLQAKLNVTSASLQGDPRFSLVGEFAPVSVDSTPAIWSFHFDDAGAPDGTYEALLVLGTEDEGGIPGGTALGDLSYSLMATIGGSAVDAPTGPAIGPRIGLIAISPNPSPGSTRISFGASRTGRIELRIHDLAGRVVRNLIEAERDRGEHDILWDGRDGRGLSSAAGIYFVRLNSMDGSWTQKITRVK